MRRARRGRAGEGEGWVARSEAANPRRRSGSLPRTGPESGRVEPAVVPRQMPESRPRPAAAERLPVAPAALMRANAGQPSIPSSNYRPARQQQQRRHVHARSARRHAITSHTLRMQCARTVTRRNGTRNDHTSVTHRPDRSGRHGRGSAVFLPSPAASVSPLRHRPVDLTRVRAPYVRTFPWPLVRRGNCMRSAAGLDAAAGGYVEVEVELLHCSIRERAHCICMRTVVHVASGGHLISWSQLSATSIGSDDGSSSCLLT